MHPYAMREASPSASPRGPPLSSASSSSAARRWGCTASHMPSESLSWSAPLPSAWKKSAWSNAPGSDPASIARSSFSSSERPRSSRIAMMPSAQRREYSSMAASNMFCFESK